MKTKYNPVEFHATDHAIKRLNERFNVSKDESGKWVRRFLNDAVELTEDTGTPDCKYFKRGQCIAVVDLKSKTVITVYQKMPAKELRGFKSNLTSYIKPYAHRIEKKYTNSVIHRLHSEISQLVRNSISFNFSPNKLKYLEKIRKLAIEIEQDASDAIDDLKTLKDL